MASNELTAPTQPLPIPTSTAFAFVGHDITEEKGACFGLVVRSVGFAKGFKGSFRALKAGEVVEYTGTLEQARRHALERMIEHAQDLGGNAVIGCRFDSSDVGDGLAEVVAYGTAVVVS